LKNDERQSALYRGYRIKWEQLKTKYWNAGFVQPAKQREKREGYLRKRLPPVILTGSMQSTPSIQSMKRDQVKGLKLSDNMERDMDTAEEVKQGKKRPNFMEPEVTPTPRKLRPLLYKQRGRLEQSSNLTKLNPTLIKKMEYAPSFSFNSPKCLKQSHLNEEGLSVLEDYINKNE